MMTTPPPTLAQRVLQVCQARRPFVSCDLSAVIADNASESNWSEREKDRGTPESYKNSEKRTNPEGVWIYLCATVNYIHRGASTFAGLRVNKKDNSKPPSRPFRCMEHPLCLFVSTKTITIFF